MDIVFDESSLEQGDGPSRSITGVIYFDFDGVPFPSERWNDFVVVVTVWWLQALETFQRADNREVELRFMDGPYWITVVRGDGNTALLRCVEDRRGAGVVHEASVDVAALTDLVRRVARRIASACARAGIESRDVDMLRRILPD